MKPKTKNILTALHIISWAIFIGLCIKTGSIIYSFFVSLVINPAAAKDLHDGLNLSGLFNFNTWYYAAIVSLIIFLSALKAFIFYLVIKAFIKTNFERPFSIEVSLLISGISYVALEIGVIALAAKACTRWLIKRGVDLPDLNGYLGGASEFLFLGGIIFIIAQVFKRGIEIQSENELTV